MRDHQGHTSAPPGKKVIVKLWDGETFIDNFLSKEGNHILFKLRGKIKKSLVKGLMIYKKPAHEHVTD